MSKLIGMTLGQYQLIESVGQGGMAHIYRAYQASIKREVVVKVLSPMLRDDPFFIERFNREVNIISHLQHPHIVPVYDYGEQDGEYYIAMAYLKGGTLANLIQKSPTGLPEQEIVRLITAMAGGLDYAHSRGVIHRDLKPSNILMDECNNPYISDFGIAKETKGPEGITSTVIAGTPTYMAPEIVTGGKITQQVDIYALGVILFEMLTGVQPYRGKTQFKVLSSHVHDPIPDIKTFRPDLPETTQNLIQKAMAKEPESRYALAEVLACGLREVFNISTPIQVILKPETGEKHVEAPIPQKRPSRFIPIITAILGLAAVILLGSFYFRNREQTPPVSNIPSHSPKPIADTKGKWTFGCLGQGHTWVADLECREISIALENRYIPFNYINLNTNKPEGFDYDMWWEMCSLLHCEPVFVEQKWDGLLQSVSDGKFDVGSGGVTITDERKQTLTFSIGYMNIDQRLVVRKGENRFKNMSGFVALAKQDNLLIGAQSDSTNLEIARQYLPEDQIRNYDEYSVLLYALTIGEIDAAVIDHVEGQTTIGGIDYQQAIKLEVIGSSLSSDQLGLALQKDSDIVGELNKALAELRAQGILDDLIEKYFGPGFTLTYKDVGLGAYGQ